MAGLSLIVSLVFVSCAGGHVSDNGIFQNDHKELKESLVGSWKITNEGSEAAGREMYEFYKEDKQMQLKVLGQPVTMERFDSPDGLSFTFEYLPADGKVVHVVGQFKSYQRKDLVCMQELPAPLSEMLSVIRLQKDMNAQAKAVVQQ